MRKITKSDSKIKSHIQTSAEAEHSSKCMNIFPFSWLERYTQLRSCLTTTTQTLHPSLRTYHSQTYIFQSLLPKNNAADFSNKYGKLICDIPLSVLIAKLPKAALITISLQLNLTFITHNQWLSDIKKNLCKLSCAENNSYLSVFTERVSKRDRDKDDCNEINLTKSKKLKLSALDEKVNIKKEEFSPKPASESFCNEIICEFVCELSPSVFSETGCAACTELHPVSNCLPLSNFKSHIKYLKIFKSVKKKERTSDSDLHEHMKGVVIDHNCNFLCKSCARFIWDGKLPKYSLANGLWIGEVPEVLNNLTWVERHLVARVRINSYVVQMRSRHLKIKGNVIAFSNPTAKIYNTLPIPLADLDQVLAIVFVGPAEPSEQQLQKSPLLVRWNTVGLALEWLKRNH